MKEQGNTPLQTAVNSNQRETSVVPTGQFNFIPVEDMFEGPETQLAEVLATDPGAIANVGAYKADIDKYGIPAMASLGVARPSLATGLFDPVKQQNPPQDTYNTVKSILKADSAGPAADIVDPRFANIRQSNFLRYYEHPDFAQLGFTPYADMESYYNANSTIWDDMSRMRGEFGSLVGSGFSSAYRSIGDLFDDDNYFSAPDIESGMEFEDAMAVGNSSRSGGLAFTNNLLLNSGYTFGIIGSIALEELILAGATYLTGGGAAPVAAARTGMNVLRLAKGAKNFFNISKMQASTRALMNQLKNYDAAKSFWQAAKSGGKVIGNVLTPQTYSALKNFKTAKNATQNANNLAKAKAGFGGFYRDFRSVNLALAESKLEGGMVYNELVREGVAIQKKKTGNVTPEQMALIQNQAGEGAFYTTMTNAPLIFLSNQIVLGNAMGGFNRSLGKVFNDTYKKGLNGRLFKGKGIKDAATGKIKDVFEDAGSGIKGWWTKVKAGGVKGNTGMAIAATARYFAANFAEGLQEIGQEAIAVGTKGYYSAVMEDPLAGGIELQNDMILSGMGSQFSGQGVETFLSGFLMGGIVQGPQKLVFQGMPALYNRISDPKAYKEYQEQKKQYVSDLVKVHNEAWNSTIDDPSGLFDPTKLNFLVQKQVAGAMKQNSFSQDRFGFTDEKDFGKFQQLYTIFQNGTSNYFRTQLTDFMQMSDEELGQAFPNQKKEIKSGKARQRLQDLVTNLDKFETSFENNKNRFTNPYDRSQYDKGSRQYILEAIKEKAFEHATYLYMFTEDGFKRATERADGIYTNLSNDPLFEKMAANDITVLLDTDSIDNEIGLLLQDIAVQDKESEDGKKTIEQKTDKIKKLQTIQKILSDPKNLTKDGSFDRRKINKLTGAFQEYVQFMAQSSNSFVDRSKIEEALKQMVDYHALKGRAKVYDKAIEYLNNPERLNEIVDRQIEVNKDIYKNLTKIHKQQIEKYINIKEANTLMNKLFEAGYVGDPEQVKKFLLTGNINELKNFYDEQGDIDPKLDKVKYDQIQRLLDIYKKMSEKTDDSGETTEQESKDIEVQKTKSNQEEILEEANIDVILPEVNDTPLLRALLDRQYRKYAGTQTVLEEKVKSFEEWRNEEGLNWQNTFNALKKLWVSGKLPVLDSQGNPVFAELTDEDIKSEKGFETWLKSREVLENDLVKEILQAAGIPLNEMYYTERVKSDPTDVTPAVGNEDDEDKIDPANPPRPSVFQVGVTSDVFKIITINQQGEAEALYKLVDKKGNNVSPELLAQIGITLNAFNDSGSAIAAMRELDKRAPDSTPFPFDGQMLFQGQLVYDKDGKEYRVISTPKFIQGGNLRLVPNNFEGKPVTLQAGQFKNSYSIQEFKFNLLPTNVSRVNITDINKLYPHANTVDGQRDYSYADDRLNLILDNLTQEEINNLVLVITPNKVVNNEASKYIVSGKEENPYVDIKQSKYSMGLAIPDGNTKTKINRILNENNIPLTDNENGVFAYIPNANVSMQDPQGKEIKSLSNISREQALNTLFVSPELKNKLDQKQALELARNNFALNALLVSYADSVINSNIDTNVVSLNELPFGLGFVIQKGGMSYDNTTTRSLKNLRYEHADENGNYFIFDLKRKKGGARSVEFITSLEGSEGVKLSNKIKSRLEKDLLWDDIKNGTDRYIAIVQLPDGSYRPVNLKARTYNKSQRDDLASKLVNRAQKTKQENLDKDGKAKDLAYNTQFNEEDIRESVFISAKGGYNISLQVTPWGKLQLQLYNTDIGKQIGDTITVDIPAGDAKSFVSDSSINGYVQTLINDFNNNEEIAESGNKISNKNFRQSFPTQVTATDLIDATTTNVRPEVVLNSSARATGDSSAIQAEIDKGNIKEDVVEAVEETNFTSEEAEFGLLDLSDAAFAEFAAKDFITLPSEYINHIVNKIVREGVDNLTTREVEVYNMRAATINVMVSKKGGEGSKLSDDVTVNPLETVKQKLETLKSQLLKGVAPKDRGKTLRTNEEYQKLLVERKAIEKEANKIMSSSDLSLTDVEDIDIFTDWAASNLPSFINIADITTLGNNLKAGGVRVGAFVLGLNHIAGGQEVSGTIYTGATSPYKYHEAFHGVFRMLLSNEEINKYRSIARKEVRAKLRAQGKSFEKELEKFKNSADTYSNMTRKQLENEYYEEYLADEFEKFKVNPKNTNTDPSVKSLFTRIIEWIKGVFNSYSKNELRTLFENIDSGKFKGAQIANNEFTTALDVGTTIEANALIPHDSISKESNLGFIYLDSDIADPLIRNISAMFLQRISKLNESYNPKEQMDSILDDFEWLYSLENPINESKTNLQKEKLIEIQSAFDNYSDEIRNQSIKYINQISDKANEEEFQVEEFEDSTGLRTTSEYEKDASMIGGFRSLSSQLRAYIATTSVEATDYFGNTELTNGEPIIIAVDFVEAYNGLLKAVKNLTDPKKILQSMYFFGQDNSETSAVVRRILNDVGISEEQLLSDDSIPLEVNSPLLFQSILKGFENFRVDYLFNERDNLGNTIVYSASERDDINSQLDRWSQGFISKRKQLLSNPNLKTELITLLAEIQSEIIPNSKGISSAKLKKDAKKYSEQLFNLSGIKISPLYIQYNMLYNRANLKSDQRAFLDLNKNETPSLTHDLDGKPYKESSIALMSQLIQDNNDIFSVDESGMDSRLKKMAVGNAPFDETIGASVFKNPNGDLVYAHQLPTYHLKKIAELNDPNSLEELLKSDPYLANNFLLNSAAFNQLSLESRLQIIRVAGNKIGSLLSTEEELDGSLQDVKQTSTYGDFTPQEFALNLINNYAGLLNSKSYKVSNVESIDDEGNKITTGLAPVLIRVMEASNTGDMISLPVIKTVEMDNGKAVLTEETVDIYIDKIRTEFARINREANNTTKTQEDILGYTDGRALTFFNTKTLMSEEQQTSLINAAIKAGNAGNTITLDDALAGTVTVSPQTSEVTKEVSGMTALRDNVVDNLENRFQVFEQLIDELKIQDQISNQVKSGPIIAAGVSRNALVQSASLLNLNDNYRHNLKQIFFNDAINSYSINEILLGDQAVSLKDSVDQIKRAKMQNGAYYSAYSAITAPSHGVVHPVDDISLVTLEEPEDSGIDIADAQMYITTKAFRYMWFGFGKLTAAQAELINRIETGQTITSDSVFGNEATPEGYAKMQALLNSKKLVYGDGSTFLKMSAFTLTPEYTSIWNEDIKNWLPQPGKETLHNLRLKLEAIEKEKETIAIAAPLSAVKMKKQRVNLLEELEDAKPFTNGVTTLDARFMGLQQLNPSNKLDQVDPTQIKQILTSEQNDDQFVPALNMTVGKIREEYNKAVSQRVTLKFKDKRNLIFSFDGAMDELSISEASGKVTPKLAAFLEFALSGLKASQSSSQILEFFSMTDGVPNYNLNNQITVRKFEQLFLSYFSKGVFSERTPGLGLTLVSDFGNKVYRRVFEIKDGVPIRSEIIRRAAWQGNENDLLNIDSLTQEDIGSEGVVVLDRLRHGVMEYDSNGQPTGQRYTEMIMPAHHKSVMDLIENTPSATMPEAISKMFGVRIPSQDNHSAMNIKWVDFMPVYYGSSAMFARELVEVSGADFDIDKVFAQFKDFYVKDGEFFEYGNKNTVEENYSDYIRYVNTNVSKSGTIYSEAYLTYDENLDAASIDNSITDSEEKAYYQFLTKQNIVTDAGLEEAGVKALQMLGLPITKAQYSEYLAKFGEPYAAPLNNKILDYKYALLGNDSVASGENPISYSPAALDILESTLATLAENSDVFKNRMLEENNDVDDLVGKILAFKANKGASIGAAVLPNLYLSLLTEYAIDLKTPISIDGVTYDSFKYTTEKNNEGDQRKQDTISSLITMATDNAKERLFSKLGLNRHALGLVSMMTSLSIPIRTSILLINNPVIQDLYSQALNKKEKFDPGIEKLVENKIDELVEAGAKASLNVNEKLLLNSINNPITQNDQETVSILSKFQELINLKTFTDKMSAPTSLTKGLGKDVATVLDKKKDIQELLSEDAPLDLTKIYNSNTWNSTYLKLFKELTDKLLPATFLSSSPVFQDILNNVVDNIDTRATTLKTEDVQNIALDLLSYLNIKGYQHNLLQNGTLNEKVLSNDLIYPNSDRSIVDVINEIKEVLESKNESNFFIDNFVIPESASDVGNNSGLNIAMANTFRNLSAPQKVDLQNSFAQLYGSLDTKNQAQTIINYIMVKDGLQLRYGSLLEAIAPFTINKFLSHINTVEQAVRGDISFESAFGLSQEQLTKEFTEGFLESNINGSKLWTFERSSTTGSLRKGVQVKDNEVTVNWNAIGLSRDVTPNYVRISDVLGNIKTYKLDSESKTYKEIDPYGSNQQTHIGFMFGPRPTYKELRAFVNAKSGRQAQDPSDFSPAIDDAFAIQQEILKADNVNIEATENSIEVQLDPEAGMTNVADTALLLEQLGLNQDAQDQSELEANIIDNVDTSLPEADELESQLTLDFEMELDEQFTTITNFWDANIQGNKEAMASLRENNILSLEDFIAEYNNGVYESEESFIDQIKKCNL